MNTRPEAPVMEPLMFQKIQETKCQLSLAEENLIKLYEKIARLDARPTDYVVPPSPEPKCLFDDVTLIAERTRSVNANLESIYQRLTEMLG